MLKFCKAMLFWLYLFLVSCGGVNFEQEAENLCKVFRPQNLAALQKLMPTQREQKLFEQIKNAAPSEHISTLMARIYRAPPEERYNHVVKKIGKLINKPYECKDLQAYYGNNITSHTHSGGY